MPIDPRRVKELFHAALELDHPADRHALLDRECAADAELRARLDALLAAVAAPASALEQPLVADATAADFALGETSAIPSGATVGYSEVVDDPAPPRPSMMLASPVGATIAGRYKVRQEIGEGGMGTVYLAEQVAPVKRLVALKLIRAGMDSRQVLARFESERQALAIMDHPHIARVLDAGTTESGHPFFVMELVRGVPLTDYCDGHRLGLPARLQLFRQICAAVQHAHQKGVIHRDLKPTNILVEDHDGHPVPKVIDFGLAKAITGLQLTEQSLFTAFGSITGTPLYMAPEQATFNAIDVDTRADIYALGVILYELLTGSTPIRKESLQRAALDEMLRLIREDEPPTPSHRISTSEGLPSLAANRHVEPGRLGRFVRGDLDWIVMKALAKERARRYDSAIGLANDVERFLNDEPVTAGPPTARYRTAKFIRRHRGRVVAAGLLLLALVGGVVGTTVGLLEARKQAIVARKQSAEAMRQEGIAQAEVVAKDQARRAEADQRRQAERRLTQIEKINEILGSIFHDLDPTKAEKEEKPLVALLGERLDQATAAIEGESIGDPLTVARMQMRLGRAQRALGYAGKAVDLFTKARATFTSTLGPDHPDTLRSMNELAVAFHLAGRLDRAIPLHEQTLAMRKAKLGPDHPDTLRGMNDLAVAFHLDGRLDRAIPLHEQTLAIQKARLGPDHPDTLRGMNDLAGAYREAGRLDRAVPLHEQTLAMRKARLGPDHPDTIESMNNLAITYQDDGQLDRAIPMLQQTLVMQKTKFGPDHPDALISMNNLAAAYKANGQPDLAIPLHEQALTMRKVKLGPNHPNTLRSMNDLAAAYNANGQPGKAMSLLEESMKVGRGDDRSAVNSLLSMARVCMQTGQAAQAIQLIERAESLGRDKLGADDPLTISVIRHLAYHCRELKEFDRSVAQFERLYDLQVARFGLEHRDTQDTVGQLVATYRELGRGDDIVSTFKRYIGALEAKFGPDHDATMAARDNFATELWHLQRHAEMIPVRQATLKVRLAKLGPDHSQSLENLRKLAGDYQAAGQIEPALEGFDRASLLSRAKLGPNTALTLKIAKNADAARAEAGLIRRAAAAAREPEIRRRQPGPESPGHTDALAELGRVLLDQGRWDEAEPMLRECLQARERLAPDDWRTAEAASMLGAALVGLKRYDEAGPLLRKGHEGIERGTAAAAPPDATPRREALERLVRFAEAMGRPDEAQEWLARKVAIAAPSPAMPAEPEQAAGARP